MEDRLSPRPAFEVYTRDGQAFRVFANGRVEGFGADPVIINRIPPLVNVAVRRALDDVSVR